MPTVDSRLMYFTLQKALTFFVEEYTRQKGVDEVTDREILAAGEGFNQLCQMTVVENVERGKRDGSIRPVEKVQRVNITPVRETIVPTGYQAPGKGGNARKHQ